jgi:hypothetical protein
MVFTPIIDSLIVLVFLVTTLKTIYSKCIAYNEEKKDDDIEAYNIQPYTIQADNIQADNIQGKRMQSNASLHNLNLLYHEEYILTSIRRNNNINTNTDIKISYECFQCYKKLHDFYKKHYFAFDHEYCESCWNTLHSKVINNRS